jgi:hypothetical protein
LLSTVRSVKQPDLLVERAIIINDDYRVDAEADGGLQFGQVIIEAAVAGEA